MKTKAAGQVKVVAGQFQAVVEQAGQVQGSKVMVVAVSLRQRQELLKGSSHP